MIFSIRAARQEEAHIVAEVFLHSWKALMPEIPVGHTDEEVRGWMRCIVMVEKRVFVAVENESVVAMMAVSEDGEGGWIDHLYVAPEHVGCGVGAALVTEALRLLRPPVRLYTFQVNTRARRFYETRGFRAVQFGDGRGNEQRMADVLYEKS